MTPAPIIVNAAPAPSPGVVDSTVPSVLSGSSVPSVLVGMSDRGWVVGRSMVSVMGPVSVGIDQLGVVNGTEGIESPPEVVVVVGLAALLVVLTVRLPWLRLSHTAEPALWAWTTSFRLHSFSRHVATRAPIEACVGPHWHDTSSTGQPASEMAEVRHGICGVGEERVSQPLYSSTAMLALHSEAGNTHGTVWLVREESPLGHGRAN